MSLTYKRLRLIAAFYIAAPIVVFLLTWIRPMIGAPLVVSFVWLFTFWLRSHRDNDAFRFRWTQISLAILFGLIWCVLCGHGAYVCQPWDWNFRNACYKDLIAYDWPVIYDNGYALVFYVGHWLVPAMLAKCFVLVVGADEWHMANFCLLLWNVIGVTLILLFVLAYGRICSFGRTVLCFLALIFFAGCDLPFHMATSCVGGGGHFFENIELWSHFYVFHSISTSLSLAFQQTIPVMLSVVLIVSEKSYAFLALFILPLILVAPFPMVGVCLILSAQLILQRGNLFWSLFSFVNICVGFIVIPTVCSYLLANSQAGTMGCSFAGPRGLHHLILFPLVFAKFAIYIIPLWPCMKRDFRLGAIFVAYLLTFSIWVGHGNEFFMYATIPMLFYLFLVIVRDFSGLTQWRQIVLVALMSVSSAAAVEDFIVRVHKTQIGVEKCQDMIGSFGRSFSDQEFGWWTYIIDNYYCKDPREYFFYKCLAR